MYRLMRRYNLRLNVVLAWSSMAPAPATGQESTPVKEPGAPAPVAAKMDIRRLTARDFTGRCWGDFGSRMNHVEK